MATELAALDGAGAVRAPFRAGRARREAEPDRIKLSWLLRLHWGAILGQAAAVAVVQALRLVELPVLAMLALLALEALVNVALEVWLRRAARVPEAVIAGAMIFDAVVLTILLALSGNHSNPFSTLYLVNVALAAVLLRPGWAWALLVISLGLFGSLFALDRLAEYGLALSDLDHMAMMRLHLQGMWVAFAIAAAFIVYIVNRVTRELALRDQELAEARGLSARRDKVAALATLAAGAAHELSTPLATIAVVTRELERSLERAATAPPGAREDLVLIRQQLGRCQDILQQMSAHAGENVGEPLVTVTLAQWIEAALVGLPGRERVELSGEVALAEHGVEGPARALARALRGLLKNALQATPGGGSVALRLSAAGNEVRAEVVDCGRGMAPEVLARAGEPFFTTKGPGEGMGLGLFLTRELAQQLGGSLELESAPGKGTTARLRLPAALACKSGGTA
jgi:two-component system sensor histidine kinase RegB